MSAYTGNWKLSALVAYHSQARGATRLVARTIADLADRRTGLTSVSIGDLVRWTGCDKQTVLSAVRALETLGEIEVHRGRLSGPNEGRQHRYRIRADVLSSLPSGPPGGGRNIHRRGGRNSHPPSTTRWSKYPPSVVEISAEGGRDSHHQVVESSISKNDPQRVRELTDIQSDSPNGESTRDRSRVSTDEGRKTELVEEARHALVALMNTEHLRPVLAEQGYVQKPGASVGEWLSTLSGRKLRSVAAKARWAQRSSDTVHDQQLRLPTSADCGGLDDQR